MSDNGQKNPLALVKKDVVDVVASKVDKMVQGGELHLPDNYSAPNAIAAWWLALQSTQDKSGRPALEVCTRDSIANATLDMVVQGLSPAKKQCYPVVYGKTLVCQRSYFGDEAVLRRVRDDVAHVYAEVIYEGDELEWKIEGGKRTVGRHVQAEENIGGPESIRGGYAVIVDEEGEVVHCERMTFEQIETSWKKSKTYKRTKGSTFHEEQPEEAVKRTVIRRACKRLINSSDDSNLLEAIHRQETASVEADIDAEVAAEANGEVIDITPGDEAGGDVEPEELSDEAMEQKLQVVRTVQDIARLEAGAEPDDPVEDDSAKEVLEALLDIESTDQLTTAAAIERAHEVVLERKRQLMDALEKGEEPPEAEQATLLGDEEPQVAAAGGRGPSF